MPRYTITGASDQMSTAMNGMGKIGWRCQSASFVQLVTGCAVGPAVAPGGGSVMLIRVLQPPWIGAKRKSTPMSGPSAAEMNAARWAAGRPVTRGT
jgi:hypothetical protein